MNKTIREIDKDINRCKNLIEENNYLEIVIGLEELIDKYNSCIENIKKYDGRVWNYSKSDLEKLMKELLGYKKELSIREYKKELTKLVDSSIDYIKNHDTLNKSKKINLIEVIRNLHNISNEDLGKEKLWEELRIYIRLASDEDIEVGSKLISIINYVLDFDKAKNLVQ